jgi:hypothetical protein
MSSEGFAGPLCRLCGATQARGQGRGENCLLREVEEEGGKGEGDEAGEPVIEDI